MGLFDIFKKKENPSITTDSKGNVHMNVETLTLRDEDGHPTMKVSSNGNVINLEKKAAINLRKESVNKICLTKKTLGDIKARVVFAIDYSGSMDHLYYNGKVQEIVERILPVALRFDDDGTMGVWMFENGYRRLPDIGMDNFDGYVRKEIMKHHMGGTRYSGVINDICKQYINKEPSDIPTYVVFITDGDCFDSDKKASEEAIRNAAKYNIFWQFVGIGPAEFNFLEELDDLKGRFLDNADFFSLNDISKISDEELYKRILNEFDSWVPQARAKGMIK